MNNLYTVWRPPSVFTTSSDVDLWLRRFNAYVTALRIDDGNEKLNLLLTLMDDETMKCIEDMLINGIHGWAEVETRMKILFGRPTKPALFYKQEFQNRRQKPEETLSQFATALTEIGRKAFPNCGMDVISEYIRDQFIVGVKDSIVFERLSLLSPPTLEAALETARNAELSSNLRYRAAAYHPSVQQREPTYGKVEKEVRFDMNHGSVR